MKPLRYKKYTAPGRCAAVYCNRRTHGRKLCNSCRSRKARLSDPVRYAYNNLCSNARRRRVICTITLEQFREWCQGVTYIGFSGRLADSWTIDRKYNDIGYHIDNIRVMKMVDNIKKYFTYDWRTRKAYQLVYPVPETAPEDLPF